MNTMKVAALVVASTSIGLLAGHFQGSHSASEPGSGPGAEPAKPLAVEDAAVLDRMAEMQQKIESLTREMADTRARQATLGAAAATPAKAAEEAAPNAEVKAQIEEDRRVQQLQTLDNRLALESRDGEWSSASETSIRSGLGEISKQLSIAEVKCASSLCKVSGSMADHGDPATLYRNVMDKLQWAGETQFTIDPSSGQVIAYLGRPGSNLVEPYEPDPSN